MYLRIYKIIKNVRTHARAHIGWAKGLRQRSKIISGLGLQFYDFEKKKKN